MAHVRTVVVQAGGKRSFDYQSNEVSVMCTVDLAAEDDPFTALAQWTESLQHHVDSSLTAWPVPAQVKRPPAAAQGRMPYDKE